ncbi:MAG: HAMP domain-containing sensor histidine kinase [Bacteroidota bacterium]
MSNPKRPLYQYIFSLYTVRYLVLALAIFSFLPSLSQTAEDKQHIDELLHAVNQDDCSECTGSRYCTLSYYYSSIDLPKGLEYADKAIRIGRENQSTELLVCGLTNKGFIYGLMEDYSHAYEAFSEAYELALKGGDEFDQSIALLNMGEMSIDADSLKKGKELLRKALDLSITYGTESIDTDNCPEGNIPYILDGLGNAFRKEGEIDSALFYYLKAYELIDPAQERDLFVYLTVNLSKLYEQKGDLYTASYLFSSNVDKVEKEGYPLDKFEYYLSFAAFQLRKKKIESAESYLKLAYDNLQGLNSKSQEITYFLLKAKIDSSKSNFQEALLAYQYGTHLRDSLQNQESAREYAELQAIFNHREAEREINHLRDEQAQKDKIINQQILLFALTLTGLGLMFFIVFNLSRTNKMRKEMNERLRELNIEKDALLRVVAHDMRSPLANVSGLLDFLESDQKNAEEILSMIRNEVNRSFNLAGNLLEMDALEHGTKKPSPSELDLHLLVRESAKRFQHAAGRKSQRIILDLSPEIGTDIMSDPVFLSRILDNLISNAIKYSPPETEVKVVTALKQGAPIIQVIDEGPGIPKESHARIFKKFSNLNNQPTGGETSNGLGLAISKMLTEQLGGTITLESDYGAGCTFTVSLPVQAGEIRKRVEKAKSI